MVVFLSISFVNTPPSVSIPSESGVTSNKSTSLTSPASTPPWIAAPKATASSGLTALLGARPKISWTSCCTCWKKTSQHFYRWILIFIPRFGLLLWRKQILHRKFTGKRYVSCTKVQWRRPFILNKQEESGSKWTIRITWRSCWVITAIDRNYGWPLILHFHILEEKEFFCITLNT